jgi:eukaryotic-like serine/threonine-protein kinase
MSTAVFSPGHVVAGRYRIEQLLGQGGMGSVYRAMQLSVGRPVALKLLSDEHIGSVDLLERFQREAVALARLEHPNTVRLFDFGTSEGGCPFLVMEFLRGTDLAQDLERNGPLRYDHALRVARQISCSLSEAHDAGIVHRDVKPANVFLCAGSSWPLVKVLDFGIVGDIVADPVAPRLTRTGTVLGSVAYMSPEQAQGLAVGPASDLYALGVVLFEMLTRRTLFDPRACTAQLIAKVMEPAPRLRDVDPALRVPDGLDVLVADLVERDAHRRPASARAVIERLDALLERADLPPLVRPVADATASVVPAPASTLRGVARPVVDSAARDVRCIPPTEPMLLPLTAGGGWSLRPGDDPPPRPPAPRRRAWRLAAAFTLVGAAAGAVGGFVGPLRSTPAGQTFAAAAAALMPAPLQGETLTEAAPPEKSVDVAPSPSSVDAPEGAPARGAASTLSASVEPPAVAEAAALATIPPAPLAPEGSVPSRRPVSAPARAPKPSPQTSRQRRSRPAAPSAAPTPPSPEPAPTSSPEPAAAPSSPDPAPAPSSPEPAPVSASSLPSRPDTLILPETLGSSATAAAPASAGTSEPTPWPAAPSEPERPAAPPITLNPSTEPGLHEPAPEGSQREWRESRHAPPLSSLAAVEAAHQAGEISRHERDELIAALRQLQADERARALGAYREGRINRRELGWRLRKIDRNFEGEPPYRERTRSRIRLRW